MNTSKEVGRQQLGTLKLFKSIKPIPLFIIGLTGLFSAYFVFSDSIPVKPLFDSNGNPRLGLNGGQIWGRNTILEVILDIPGYSLLFISIILILLAVYRFKKQYKLDLCFHNSK